MCYTSKVGKTGLCNSSTWRVGIEALMNWVMAMLPHRQWTQVVIFGQNLGKNGQPTTSGIQYPLIDFNGTDLKIHYILHMAIWILWMLINTVCVCVCVHIRKTCSLSACDSNRTASVAASWGTAPRWSTIGKSPSLVVCVPRRPTMLGMCKLVPYTSG